MYRKDGDTAMIRKSIRNAWKVYTAQFGQVLKFLGVELCILLAALTPALFLWDSGLKFLALLVVPMFVLLVFPARMNAARTMADALNDGKLCSCQLVDLSHFGSDLLNGVRSMLLLMIWSLPLAAAAVTARHFMSEGTNAITLLQWISNLGGGGRDGIQTGVIRLLLIAVGLILLIALGCGFHSARRHCLVRKKKDLIRGHHGKNLLCWLIASLLTLLPAIIALALALLRYAPLVADMNSLVNSVMMGNLQLPDTKTTLMILGAGFLLTLPLLPLRSLITAAFTDGLEKA